MDTKVQILKLFITLDISNKLSLLEELASLLESSEQMGEELKETEEGAITDPSMKSGYNVAKVNNLILRDKEKTLGEESEGMLQQETATCCRECNSTKIINWGFYRNMKRHKCKDCGHTFTKQTGTVFDGIKKINEFVDYGETMFNGQYLSLTYMSNKYGICRSTSFDWRHKYLSSIAATKEETKFTKNVEMDDVWVSFNEKGRRLKNDSRKRAGLQMRGDNDKQVKVLFTVERGGNSNLTVVRSGRLTEKDIVRAVGGSFAKGAVLISDKHASIAAFAKETQLEHKSFTANEHCEGKEVHVQTINSMASRFKDKINIRMRGVATKYLQNYANWFNMEERYKGVINKMVKITGMYLENQIAWGYYVNLEKTYKRFLDKYSRLKYEHPTKRQWKSCNWNYSDIEKVLI